MAVRNGIRGITSRQIGRRPEATELLAHAWWPAEENGYILVRRVRPGKSGFPQLQKESWGIRAASNGLMIAQCEERGDDVAESSPGKKAWDAAWSARESCGPAVGRTRITIDV